MQIALVLVNLLLGLLACFFGYRLLRAWLALVGWQFGVSAVFLLLGGRIGSEVLLLVLTLLSGMAMAVVFYALFKPAVFIAGALVFGSAAYSAMLATQGRAIAWIVLLAGLAGGLLTLISVRPILIVTTALGGSLAVMDSIAALVTDQMPARLFRLETPFGQLQTVLFAAGLLVLFLLGLVFQFRQPGQKASSPPRGTQKPGDTHTPA